MKISLCILAIVLSVSITQAATYYVDPNIGNDTNNGSIEAPKLTIAAGIDLMSGGDTLILNDGVYAGALNMMVVNSSPSKFPPSGIDRDHPTTIKAAHIGQAIIDGEYTRNPFSNANQSLSYNMSGTMVSAAFLNIDGIHFRRGSAAVFEIKGHYHKVTNCGFEDGMSPENTGQIPIADIVGSDASHILFEDCWVWGKGRYGLYFGGNTPGAYNSIFRRIVVRIDEAGAGPYAGIMFYNGHNNVCQNCVVVDSTNTATAVGQYGAFSVTSNVPEGSKNNQVVGSIALNNSRFFGYLPQNAIETMTFKDTVLWGNGQAGMDHSSNVIGVTVASNMTIGANTGDGVQGNNGYTASSFNLKNIISANNTRYGLNSNIITADYVDTFGNLAATATATPTHAITVSPFTSALKYLPRIETGSNLKGTGFAGADIGANILYQTGVSGAFYGDTGWDSTTTNQLWPFPNESVWAAKMKAYTASGPGGNRGFAALSGSTETPLTDYIWSYLGNPMTAANIYSSPVPGICGSSNGLALSSAPTIELCTAGTPSAVSGTGPWAWTCEGSGGGSTASCGATLLEIPSGGASAAVACSAIAGFR